AALLEAWPRVTADATLVIIGDGPLLGAARATLGTRALGPLERAELPVAYAASELALLPSIPTARFREPWGLVCNEAMHQGRPLTSSPAHCPTENSASRSCLEYVSNATIVWVRTTPESWDSRSVTTCASSSASRSRRIATKSHSPVTEYASATPSMSASSPPS